MLQRTLIPGSRKGACSWNSIDGRAGLGGVGGHHAGTGELRSSLVFRKPLQFLEASCSFITPVQSIFILWSTQSF